MDNPDELEDNPDHEWSFENFASGSPRTLDGQPASPEDTTELMNDAAELLEVRKQLKEKGVRLTKMISDDATQHQEKQKAISELLTAIIPVLLNQMTSIRPNADISLAVSRTTSLLKELSSQFERTEKHRLDAIINPHTEKFQEAFTMFFDDVIAAARDADIPTGQMEVFKGALADRLRGFEERVDALNGESMSAKTRRSLSISSDAKDVVKIARGEGSTRFN